MIRIRHQHLAGRRHREAGWLRDTLRYMNLWDASRDFGKGIVDSRLLTYTVTLTLFLLVASTRTLDVRKAR